MLSCMRSLPLVQCCAPLAEPALSDAEAKELERVFKALADRHRVRVLNRLLSAGGEAVCVCEFEDMLGLKQSTVSYHLKQLLDAGIVEREKRGSYAYFSLAPGALEQVCGLLGQPAAVPAAA
jgi:ArsR family transcriptional regulator